MALLKVTETLQFVEELVAQLMRLAKRIINLSTEILTTDERNFNLLVG